MAENQTVETGASVDEFLDGVDDATQRADARILLEVMRKSTGAEPRMWGPAIVGFGKYRYRYASGRTGETPRVSFSPRKGKFTLYLMSKDPETDALLEKLGKHKRAGGCIYISKMRDVDHEALAALVAQSWRLSEKEHPTGGAD